MCYCMKRCREGVLAQCVVAQAVLREGVLVQCVVAQAVLREGCWFSVLLHKRC